MLIRSDRMIAAVALLIAMTAPTATTAQMNYPTKPVQIIVPFSPGGASDLLPRILAPKLTELWGQQVIVFNRPGAGGNIGMSQGSKAAPDGYTLTLAPQGNL